MAVTNLLSTHILLQLILLTCHIPPPLASAQQNSNLFREYIGAEFNDVKFSDIPINPGVEFHFILSFAIDLTADGSSPTNGQFNIFWDTGDLSASQIAALKQDHSNVRVALSIGGDAVAGGSSVYFNPTDIDSWVANAVNSLTGIIQQYNLDGIDIDYEHFSADPDTFAECIGRLVTTLKSNDVISFASIAPFDDDNVQRHYIALWNKYGDVIDYVNFQFYADDSGTTVDQFLSNFEKQCTNYEGGRVLVSISTGGGGGLKPEDGFFDACRSLKMQGKLHGIFVWSADDSKKDGYRHEMTSQYLLTSAR